jgi:hypothetical protein
MERVDSENHHYRVYLVISEVTEITPTHSVAEPEIMDRGRSKEIMDRGAGPKIFNHKITECSLFVWIFTLWMGSSKDKIQICVILLSKAFIISF